MVITKTGKLWDDQLRSLLRHEPPLTLSTISEEMNFSRYMVQKHALRLKEWRNEWSGPVREMVDRESLTRKREKERRQLKRKRWLKLQEEIPGASRSELRTKVPSVARYLSKHDKEWYDRNSPKKRDKQNRKKEKM